MEKKVYELTIDPEFQNLIPPLSADDLENLGESIAEFGCEDELVTWNGVIIDGHNRYHICHALNIPFAYRERNFSSREEVKKWMIDRSLGRRNMSRFGKTVLALKYDEVLKKEAEERMKAGVKADPPPLGAEGSTKGETRDKVATMAGVGHNYVDRVKKILEVADEKTIDKLFRDEAKVATVYYKLFPKKEKEKPADTVLSYSSPPTHSSDEVPANVEMIGKKGIHVEGKMPDEPESFPVVLELLESVARNYLVSLEHTLKQYTPGMMTEEHNKEIISMFRGTSREATSIIKKWLEEVAE